MWEKIYLIIINDQPLIITNLKMTIKDLCTSSYRIYPSVMSLCFMQQLQNANKKSLFHVFLCILCELYVLCIYAIFMQYLCAPVSLVLRLLMTLDFCCAEYGLVWKLWIFHFRMIAVFNECSLVLSWVFFG